MKWSTQREHAAARTVAAHSDVTSARAALQTLESPKGLQCTQIGRSYSVESQVYDVVVTVTGVAADVAAGLPGRRPAIA